jgi:uncharacterized membrane protein
MKKLLDLVEQEAAHRRALELQSLEARVSDEKAGRLEARVGQIFALLIGIVAVVSGTYTAVSGAQLAGSFIGGGGVIGLVTVFIVGRRVTVSGLSSGTGGSSSSAR